jgi:hypothetical protein
MERSPEGLRLAQACEQGDEAKTVELTSSHPNLISTLSDDDRPLQPVENPGIEPLQLVAAALVQAVRSPVTLKAHEWDPVLTPPVGPGLLAFEGEALEMGVLVGPHQPAHPGDHPDGGDRAVVDLDVPIDLGAGAERPGDGGRNTTALTARRYRGPLHARCVASCSLRQRAILFDG